MAIKNSSDVRIVNIDTLIDDYIKNEGNDNELISQLRNLVYSKIDSSFRIIKENKDAEQIKEAKKIVNDFTEEAAKVLYKILYKRWQENKYGIIQIGDYLIPEFKKIIERNLKKKSILNVKNDTDETIFTVYFGLEFVGKIDFTTKILDISARNYVMNCLKKTTNFEKEIEKKLNIKNTSIFNFYKEQDYVSPVVKETIPWDPVIRPLSSMDKNDITVALLENSELLDSIKNGEISDKDYETFTNNAKQRDDKQNIEIINKLIGRVKSIKKDFDDSVELLKKEVMEETEDYNSENYEYSFDDSIDELLIQMEENAISRRY